MQDEINQKNIQLSIKAVKLTEETLKKAIQEVLRKMEKSRQTPKVGRNSLKRLASRDGSSNMIEIADRLPEFEQKNLEKVKGLAPTPERTYKIGGIVRPKGYNISFKNVLFSYQDKSDSLQKYAIRDVSMVLPEGKMTAHVGPSGGGKSTVTQLIARFWDVEQGSSTISDTYIRDIPIHELMDQIAFVFQNTHIFSASLLENLIIINKKVSAQHVEAAIKATQCEDIVSALPNGYDTLLGSGGCALSGGEAQRLAIARVILKNAPIVLLDESMSFADAENEAMIQKAIASLLGGKTVLIIAHRLYSIQNADNTIVLDNRQVVEQGTHSKLLQENGLYHHLWNTQNDVDS